MAVAIVVHYLENSLQTNDTSSSSLLHLFPKSLHDFLFVAHIACAGTVLLNIYLLS